MFRARPKSVRLKSRPKSKTTRPITHDPGNIARGRPSQRTPRRARPKRASRETSLAAAQPIAYHGRCIRPSRERTSHVRPRISSAKFIRRPRRPTANHPPRPFRLGPRPDCPADRPARPSQRRGRPEALFEAQTYVFKPGLTLSRL
ncbi:unnamed protein product [Microthlaspi erraticum]|uniref:Uncharacterized protein n=1 Tax=Microthlaspi erraticum TaxID=1685480 RepID=A0A6D2L016_9BRAS|nr:unnamed protein product [Microthlaspi erraticum]